MIWDRISTRIDGFRRHVVTTMLVLALAATVKAQDTRDEQ